MSPIDDELRSTLHARTSNVTSSPDFFTGIEQRAGRMRRNRAAAAVAGSALTVAALGVGGPVVASLVTSDRDRTPIDMAQPPDSTVQADFALDPADPWEYRGDPSVIANGSLETFEREFEVAHGEAEFVPLFGHVYEPAQSAELVYVATTADGEHWWGVVRSSESGPEFLLDEPLPANATALPAALPGDEVPRLLVVADPDVDQIQYAPDGRNFTDMSATATDAPGVAVTALEGDLSNDEVVVKADNAVVFQGPAPDPAPGTEAPEDEGPGTGEVPGDEVPAPSNVVDWPARGGVDADLLERAVQDFADTNEVPREAVGAKLLYAGERDGRVYVLIQGWYGGDARTFAWFYDTRGDYTASVLQGFTAPGPAVLAASLEGVLIVVPEPRAGQVMYAPDGGEPKPVADQGTEAAVLIDRPETRTGDRLLVLDGNGDFDRPIYRGTVAELLASMQ